MLRKWIGYLGVAAMAFTATALTSAPAAADGCDQRCGTQFNQCIVDETAGSCFDQSSGETTCNDNWITGGVCVHPT